MTRADLSIYQGDDYGVTVTVRNADGTPADLTGYTVLAQVRREVADMDSSVDAEFSVNITSPTINLSLSHSQTQALSGRYVWDLQVVSSAGIVTTIMAGKIGVTAEVSRVAAA